MRARRVSQQTLALGEMQMERFKSFWLDLTHDESGQDLIEYALVAALVGLGAVASMRSLTTSIATLVSNIGTTLSGAV